MNVLIYLAEILGAVAAAVTAFSVLYAKFVKPVKKHIADLENNKEEIGDIKADLKTVHKELKDQNDYETKNRAITMKSLIAILDGLEQSGCNGTVTKTKKELITYMAKNLNGKK